MNISFPDRHAIDTDTFNFVFPAIVDGEQIRCMVTREALQDINPSCAADSSESQFETNKFHLQTIAKEKILAGEIKDGIVTIASPDV